MGHFPQNTWENMLYNDLLTKLTYLTKRNDITQLEVGKAIGIDKGAINARAKRNSKFKPDEIKKIEKHFDIKLNSIEIVSNTFETINNEQLLKNYQLFGHRIAYLQDELGYLDKALARLIGTDENRYIQIKLGKEDATALELARLASKVDVSLDWLIKG